MELLIIYVWTWAVITAIPLVQRGELAAKGKFLPKWVKVILLIPARKGAMVPQYCIAAHALLQMTAVWGGIRLILSAGEAYKLVWNVFSGIYLICIGISLFGVLLNLSGKMIKMVIVIVALVCFIWITFPQKFYMKDGGSYGYRSPSYQITCWHGMGPDGEPDYFTGTTVELFGVTVYDTLKKSLYIKYKYPNEQFFGKEVYQEIDYVSTNEEKLVGEEIIKTAESVFSGSGQDEGTETLKNHYFIDKYEETTRTEYKMDLITTHVDGNEGFVWIVYDIVRMDREGHIINQSKKILSRWKIRKDETWKVIEVKEAP